MAIHDLLSNHSLKKVFANGTLTAAEVSTESLDLSKGTTANFMLMNAGLGNFSASSSLDNVIIQYSDDEDFSVPANIVDDPLDATTNLSTLGNTIYNLAFTGDWAVPDLPATLMTEATNAGQPGYVPFALDDNAVVVAVNVVNPVGTKRYCRVQFSFTIDGGDTAELMTGFGFVGPVAFKNSNGGIA